MIDIDSKQRKKKEPRLFLNDVSFESYNFTLFSSSK